MMPSKRHTAGQIVSNLREAEVLLAKGAPMPQACRKLGVREQTYYRWRKEYGGVRSDQVNRLKALEKENARLKKVAAYLTLDNAHLKEAAYPNF
jgi:transposase-like protein